MLLAKQLLLIIKLPKFIEINHNAMYLAQFQKIKKIFQFADQLSQKLTKTTKTTSLTILTRNTLHTAKVLLS
jgi:hypothetical protein